PELYGNSALGCSLKGNIFVGDLRTVLAPSLLDPHAKFPHVVVALAHFLVFADVGDFDEAADVSSLKLAAQVVGREELNPSIVIQSHQVLSYLLPFHGHGVDRQQNAGDGFSWLCETEHLRG